MSNTKQRKITNADFEHMFGADNGMDAMCDKYEAATGKKMMLTISSFEEFKEWIKENEPDFYNSYKS